MDVSCSVQRIPVEGDAANFIDMKAGIEHFGRMIPDRMDVIAKRCVMS